MARKFYDEENNRDHKRNRYSEKELRKQARANKFANATRWQDETDE